MPSYKEYTMTQKVYTRLTAKLGKLLCLRCDGPIFIGHYVVSKKNGHGERTRNLRHRICAKQVNLI